MVVYKQMFVWIICLSLFGILILLSFQQTTFSWHIGIFVGKSEINLLSGRLSHIKPYSVETQEERQSLLQEYCQRIKKSTRKVIHVHHVGNNIFLNKQHSRSRDERTEFMNSLFGRNSRSRQNGNFFYNKQQKLIYCQVPKIACTTWRRILYMFEGYQKTFMEIPKFQIHHLFLKRLEKAPKYVAENMKEKYFSFMFSRHPHDRLFSAYRNKFMDPKNRTHYLETFGPYIAFSHLKDTHSINNFVKENNIDKKKLKVTFEQFVRFILEQSPSLDIHWEPYTDICKICDFKFNHLGKFETLNKDAKVILYSIQQPQVYEMLGDDTLYTRKTTTMLKKYYGELPKELLPKIYEFYKGDFEAFGYDPYFYINY